MPLHYWNLALETAVYIYNITPHSSLNFISPYKKLNNKKLKLDNIKIQESIAYYLNKTQTTKLEPRAKQGILVGFNNINYKVLDIETNRIIQTRDVRILENQFYNFKNNTIYTNNNKKDSSIILEINEPRNTEQNREEEEIRDSIEINSSNNSSSTNTISRESSPDELGYTINSNNKRIINHSNNLSNKRTNTEIIDNKIDELSLLITEGIINKNNKPSTYKEAINSINKNNQQKAMQEEIN